MINEADVEWTSLDDDVADGSDADERGGDGDPDNPAAPTNPNDYENEDNAEVVGNLSNQYAFTKAILSTTQGHTGTADGTDPAIEDLVVGEMVTYVLTATIGEGTTPQVRVTDTLDLANGVLDIRNIRITAGSNLTASVAPGFNFVSPATFDSNSDSYIDSLFANFGTVVNDASGTNAVDGQIRIEVDAMVVNVLANQEGDVVNNSATLSFLEDLDSDGDADDLRQITDDVDIEIVEPTLDVTKSIPLGTTEADAGDVVGYQIVIDNSSDIDAFEVTFQDILPTQMDIQTGTFTATRTSDSGDVSAFFTVTVDDINHVAPGFTLASGDSIHLPTTPSCSPPSPTAPACLTA